MSEGYYNSKKTDDICGDVCSPLFNSSPQFTLPYFPSGNSCRIDHVKTQMHFKRVGLQDLHVFVCGCPNRHLLSVLAWTKISYFLRPLWESPPKPFHEIPHYYHENVSMETLCRLHGWGIRDSPRRVFDAVLFSNEVDILTIRWKEMHPYGQFKFIESRLTYGVIGGRFKKGENPFVEEAYQRVALDRLLKIAGIEDDDLLIMSDVDEIPSAHTINLLRWCNDIPHVLHLQMRNYLIQDVICKGADLFDMLPEEYTFKEIIGKMGPIPHSYSAVHLPSYLLNNAEKYNSCCLVTAEEKVAEI
ncbi:Glycosyl transferase, family 17 [Sesbania bispinosa]|nr:Glycosyl transferase, family 17 [Sesbania bispinosa]